MNKERSFINYNSEQSELLNSFHLKRQEAKESLKELRKKYNALKTKVKNYEKKIIFFDEEKDRLVVSVISSNVQLALNKYIVVEKNIKIIETTISRMDKEYDELRNYSEQYQGQLTEKLKRISSPSYEFHHSTSIAKDQIRIANKHLKKISDFFAFLRKLNRIPKKWDPL